MSHGGNSSGPREQRNAPLPERKDAACSSSSECVDRLAEVEREMARLKESTKSALQQSWDEVEELQQRISELERDLVASKTGEEFWRRKYEEVSIQHNLYLQQQKEQQQISTIHSSAASVIAEDNDGMLNIVGNNNVSDDMCFPDGGILKKLRRRCSNETASDSLSRQSEISRTATSTAPNAERGVSHKNRRYGSGECSSESCLHVDENNTISTACTPLTVPLSCTENTSINGASSRKKRLPWQRGQHCHEMQEMEPCGSKNRQQWQEDKIPISSLSLPAANDGHDDSLTTLGSSRTTFSGIRSILLGTGSERGQSWKEEERKKMEAELLQHLSLLESEKNEEIEELRLKLSGRDAAITSLEEGAAAHAEALRAEAVGLQKKLMKKKAAIASQAKMIAEMQEYITELCNELRRCPH